MSEPLATPEMPAAPVSKRKRRHLLIGLASIFILAGLAWWIMWHFVWSTRITTDDAYVRGNQVVVASAVPGTVVAVLAGDTDRVITGQPLVRLEQTDARLNLAGARHALDRAVRAVAAQFAEAQRAAAEVKARRATLAQVKDTLQRNLPLLKEKAVASLQIAQMRNALRSSRAALQAALRQASAAQALIGGTDIAHNPAVLSARDVFRAAWVALHRDTILAPVSGYVALRTVQVGARVQPGQPLMQIIPLGNLWVVANFKETKLAKVRIGQPTTITSDLYGSDIVYHGKVLGLGAGTGSTFALLPPQNATGNWIKVVQRLPVRISINPQDLARHPLRVGLSMNVKVMISDQKGLMLAQQPRKKPLAVTAAYQHELAGADTAANHIIAAAVAAARRTGHGSRR